MMIKSFQLFTNSTGLCVNPDKCRMYFGGKDNSSKIQLLGITKFVEGSLDVKYLGVPLASKKLKIHHYMPLIERIVGRINHWTMKLLSYVDRVQLIKSILCAIAQYQMICFPIPKFIIRNINAICRTFIWTCSYKISRNNSVAWKTVCSSRKQGGLDIINLSVWNEATLLKCLWNLCRKEDNLWMKWIHTHYFKKQDVLQVDISNSGTWIIKSIMRQRGNIARVQNLQDLQQKKFPMKSIYEALNDDNTTVLWSNLFSWNMVRPRAQLCLWLACHRKLVTKDRVKKSIFCRGRVP